MAALFQTLIGVAISVILFLIGYRQTVGAKKERVQSANKELESTLLKRIVLESYNPNYGDISRLIEGKARDHRIRPRDLLSESQILNILFTRIVESDFITHGQRDEILKRLSPTLIAAEEKPIEEIKIAELAPSKKAAYYRLLLIIVLAGLASSVGAILTLVPKYIDTGEIITPASMSVFTASLALILTLYIIFRVKESQEEHSSGKALETAIDFERQVVKLFQKFGSKPVFGAPDKGYDFFTEVGGKKIIIEVKAWTKHIPPTMIVRVLQQLSNALEKSRAEKAIIVTKERLDLPRYSISDTRIQLMSIRELRNLLAHGRI